MTQDEIKKALENLCIYDLLSHMQDTENFEKFYGEYFRKIKGSAVEDFQTFMNAPEELIEKAYQEIKDDRNSAMAEEKAGDNDPDEIHFYEAQLEALEELRNAQKAKRLFEQFSDEDLKRLELAGKSRDDIKANPEEAKRFLEELKKEDKAFESKIEETQREKSTNETGNFSEDDQDKESLHVSEENKAKPSTGRVKGWIELKQEWFAEKQNDLWNYTPIYPNAENPNEFKVGFDGGTIHYTSPVDVTISQDADFKIYDILLQDPDNKDKIIDFPQDASEHLTTMLFASAVLNKTAEGKAHQMANLDKSKINFELLEKTLNGEQYAELKAYIKCQEALERLSDRERNKQEAAAEAYIKRAQAHNKNVSFEKIIANSAFVKVERS